MKRHDACPDRLGAKPPLHGISSRVCGAGWWEILGKSIQWRVERKWATFPYWLGTTHH